VEAVLVCRCLGEGVGAVTPGVRGREDAVRFLGVALIVPDGDNIDGAVDPMDRTEVASEVGRLADDAEPAGRDLPFVGVVVSAGGSGDGRPGFGGDMAGRVDTGTDGNADVDAADDAMTGGLLVVGVLVADDFVTGLGADCAIVEDAPFLARNEVVLALRLRIGAGRTGGAVEETIADVLGAVVELVTLAVDALGLRTSTGFAAVTDDVRGDGRPPGREEDSTGLRVGVREVVRGKGLSSSSTGTSSSVLPECEFPDIPDISAMNTRF
jgi:hypothetical protein